jgi:hypothetical protein
VKIHEYKQKTRHEREFTSDVFDLFCRFHVNFTF